MERSGRGGANGHGQGPGRHRGPLRGTFSNGPTHGTISNGLVQGAFSNGPTGMSSQASLGRTSNYGPNVSAYGPQRLQPLQPSRPPQLPRPTQLPRPLPIINPNQTFTGQQRDLQHEYQQYPQPPPAFNNPPFPQPLIPFEAFAEFHQPEVPVTTAGFEHTLDSGLVTSGPVVHEGFVPAPGNEWDDDLDGLYSFTPGYGDSLLQSDDERDSEDEQALLEEEERILRDIENKNDRLEDDADFSMDDIDEYEDDPDERMLDDEFDDEERPQPRRGGSSTRGGRGRGSWRGRGKGSRRGGLRRGRPKKGERKIGRPPGKQGPRPAADPGPQFKEFQRLANDAYLRKDYPTAIEYVNKAIQINPEIFAAHSLLSEIYADMGHEQMSINALMIGAPTKRDKELWFHIIERLKEIDPDEYPALTNSTKTALILDCLNAIIDLDDEDYDARCQKLEIEAQLGRVSKSVQMCRKLLTMKPHDDEILKIMAKLGTSSAKMTRIHLERMIASFDTSIAYFLAHDEPATSNLGWSLLNMYTDLLYRAGEYDRGLSRLKSLSRWIQKRKDESYWNDQDDDREFDLEDIPRRKAVPGFKRKYKAKYGKTLPLELRARMGLFRLRQDPSRLEEAMHHLEMLDPDDHGPDAIVKDYPDLFTEIADELHATEHSREALRFYEALYDQAFKHIPMKTFIGMFTSYKLTDQRDKANELIPILQKWNPDSVKDLAVLAKFFEDNGMEKDAMKRAEAVFRNGDYRLLLKVGFRRYAEIKEFFFQERKRARGSHGYRKSRVRKYMKALRTATRDKNESEDEDAEEMPSLGPRSGGPKPGLFRSKKSLPDRRPKTFLPDEIPGTNVPTEAVDQGIFREKVNRLANNFAEELKAARAQHREIIASFQRLEELSDAAEDANEEARQEWMSIARELIEEFSTFDLFYSDRRRGFVGYFRRIGAGEFWKEAALMVLAVAANNSEDGTEEPEIKEKPDKAPEEFWGINFHKWFDIFAQYAIFLATQGDDDRCFNTLEVASQSNVFYRSQRYTHQIQICRLGCALALDDSLQGSAAVRWLMRTYPYSSNLFRLYGGINRLCSVPTGFATGPAMKVMLRWIKTMDYALLKSEQREWFNFRGDHQEAEWTARAVSTDILKYVKDHDPALFALYGHVLSCGGSYMGALNYYFRAFTITPEDPVLNLSIGVAYIQHATKRLSENRQFQLQQGLAFIYRYHELRTKDDVAVLCSEAEFNLGRIWHALGLVTQAIPAYERCIQLSKRVQEEARHSGIAHSGGVEDFATEAAFAIQTIYALTGNFEGARKITEEALVIE